MRTNKNGEFRSSVYTQRPPYADFDAPAKFQAIQSIIAKRLREHPNAMCSYSGGSDSDIMMHMIETARKIFNLPPVKYFFFETGLEMDATRRHVKEMAEHYGVGIQTIRPKKNIVQATRECGQPFVSKIMSAGLEAVQKKNIPLSIADEYDQAEDKAAKRKELKSRYPGCEQAINFLCCCNSAGEPRPNIQLVINSSKYMLDFIKENPIPFRVSNHCCDICKKQPAHAIEKQFDMVIALAQREQAKAEAERDALLEQIKARRSCLDCKHFDYCEFDNATVIDCMNCVTKNCPCYQCGNSSRWEWRGLTETPEEGERA